MKDKPMELILIILLLVVLFGGGFGYYRGGYYRQGGPVGMRGILRVVLVVPVIVWLGHGHLGVLYLGASRAPRGPCVIAKERIVLAPREPWVAEAAATQSAWP